MIDAKAERHYILQIVEELRAEYPEARAGFAELERRIRQHEQDYQSPKPSDPIAKTLDSLVTPKQLVAIRALAKARGLNEEDECKLAYKCLPQELNRVAASWLIDYLKAGEAERAQLRQAGDPDLLRINRAKAIADMALVERDFEGFNVMEPGIRRETYRIWRDEAGRVRCSCPEFQERAQQEPRFRCVHILAVKFHLTPAQQAG